MPALVVVGVVSLLLGIVAEEPLRARALTPDRPVGVAEQVAATSDAHPFGPAAEPPGWQGDDDRHRDWGWGWWVIMPIMMVVFWGALIAAAVWGIRQFTRGRSRERPLNIARERLARGEITKEEFDRIHDDLVE